MQRNTGEKNKAEINIQRKLARPTRELVDLVKKMKEFENASDTANKSKQVLKKLATVINKKIIDVKKGEELLDSIIKANKQEKLKETCEELTDIIESIDKLSKKELETKFKQFYNEKNGELKRDYRRKLAPTPDNKKEDILYKTMLDKFNQARTLLSNKNIIQIPNSIPNVVVAPINKSFTIEKSVIKKKDKKSLKAPIVIKNLTKKIKTALYTDSAFTNNDFKEIKINFDKLKQQTLEQSSNLKAFLTKSPNAFDHSIDSTGEIDQSIKAMKSALKDCKKIKDKITNPFVKISLNKFIEEEEKTLNQTETAIKSLIDSHKKDREEEMSVKIPEYNKDIAMMRNLIDDIANFYKNSPFKKLSESMEKLSKLMEFKFYNQVSYAITALKKDYIAAVEDKLENTRLYVELVGNSQGDADEYAKACSHFREKAQALKNPFSNEMNKMLDQVSANPENKLPEEPSVAVIKKALATSGLFHPTINKNINENKNEDDNKREHFTKK